MDGILKGLDYVLNNYETIFAMLIALYALMQHLKHIDRMYELDSEKHALHSSKERRTAIIEAIPSAVKTVEGINGLVGNEKAEKFIEKLKEILKAVGVEITEDDIAGLKVMGSADHKHNQEWSESMNRNKKEVI